jgi:diguanylate cyclase (GGDEF)-like protein/PAS domain S-box-containing protein
MRMIVFRKARRNIYKDLTTTFFGCRALAESNQFASILSAQFALRAPSIYQERHQFIAPRQANEAALSHKIRTGLRYIFQGSTLSGIAVIVLVWLSVAVHLRADYNYTLLNAQQSAGNLAGAFEEHVVSSISEVDKTLLFLRKAYDTDPDNFKIKDWVHAAKIAGELGLQVGIIGSNGYLTASSTVDLRRDAKIELGDRQHIKVHEQAKDDTLFISAPVIRRVSAAWSLQLTRRIQNNDGSYGGVISAGLDPAYFTRFYTSMDLGARGTVALVGLDGIVRAAAGFKTEDLGRSLAGTELFRMYRKASAGSYADSRFLDPYQRLISYRAVRDLPLIVAVTRVEDDVFAKHFELSRWYYAIATLLTLFVFIAILLGVRHRIRLDAAREELRLQHLRVHAALNNMAYGVCLFDSDQRVLVNNSRYAELYGLSQEDVKPGTKLADIIAKRMAKAVYSVDETNEHILSAAQDGTMSVRKMADGRSVAVTRHPMPEGGWVVTHEDITERQRAEARISHLATHDPLTDLPNRVLLEQRMQQAFARLHRSGEGFAVLMMDLDRFKNVNDSRGHLTGDALLKGVAERLQTCIRDVDFVARLGGDEFAILQTSCAGRNDAVCLARRILDRLSASYAIDGIDVSVGTSIGIAIAPLNAGNPEELLKNADLALYRAKSEGRNRFEFFESGMDFAAQSQHTLEMELRGALERSEFELHYQPLVDLSAANRVTSMEALVRWRHPVRGLVAPAEFITIAEESGLMIPLGKWILERACQDASTWPAALKVSVNLSPVQFRGQDDLFGTIVGILDRWRPPSTRLNLEITESVVLTGNLKALELLRQLRDVGVGIALDDFGTGYASLTHLRAFAFDKIKIDKSFIKLISSDPESGAIVCAVAGLARALNMSTTAEGVETEEQLELVRAAGCSEAQGFLFSPAVPASEVCKLLDHLALTRRAA